ncbi:hypothetical protein EEL31_08855 [Brevibacillus laterosporus]|nr:hypothetical protein [Brevibacillus laterosporus]TPG68617.1 hypothetical protein EEL31_08855 [Brevibacillus laterosporus]
MTEQDSLIAWLNRRLEYADRGALRLYVLYFEDMWRKVFGTLSNVPDEVYDQIRIKRESLQEIDAMDKAQVNLISWMYDFIVVQMKLNPEKCNNRDIELLQQAIKRRFPKYYHAIVNELCKGE